ncbi:EF-hand domain-containing protein [Dokdonella fugitiva]|jgi:hypothetical protein|uniref:EF hand domain-containing protein n=1 Tax=Dokdonella fugitiva TaxID=328517 RepID=A0A4R2IFS0_9GAMM|nr:EF-hand domain-containing protein [Dokdonella fugitiva]MBA8882946.1 hypothetical protein [Dokdonella fugitiva]TCO43076.1 EF hand domain-containing protein [Dokdonella fugitiva]
MRIPTPLLLALALAAGPACATEAPDDAGSHAARRAEFEQRFLDQVDADHDGMVSRAEYQAWVDRRFAKLDANGDGRVDADEIAASPQATRRAHRRAERLIKHFDTDGSGSISKADYEARQMARFDRLSGGSDSVDAQKLLPRRGDFGRRHDATAMPDDQG